MILSLSRQLILLTALAGSVPAAITVTLTPGLPSPQPLGTSIKWTATVVDTQPGDHLYRFTTQPTGLSVVVKQDFGDKNEWTWTPSGYEDTVRIAVIVVNKSTGASGSTATNYTVTSRLTGGAAVINQTTHPLVAFFSAPACAVPNRMRVRYQQVGQTKSFVTNMQPCRADGSPSANLKSMNFHVAGMYPNSTYMMNFETLNPSGALVLSGTQFPFTTGAIPSGVQFPTFTVGIPAPAASQSMPILYNTDGGDDYNAVAIDLEGKPLWYFPIKGMAAERTWYGGNMLYREGSTLQQFDLVGNVTMETTVRRVSNQLVAAGYPAIAAFHHDARFIQAPGKAIDGYILVLGYTSMLSEQYQGGTPGNPVEILSDVIVVLDKNMQVFWAWNPYQHLDLTRRAILDEKCFPTSTCKPLHLPVANDWTHSNSLQYTPWDGNIIMSMRHQDWTIKVNFADGAGDGAVIWKLGKDGDFAITTNGTQNSHDVGFPWFSHQHDAEFELGGKLFNGRRILTIFDNGNTRRAQFNPNANSRCQSFAIDETNLTVNLNINADTAVYSASRGNAQLLNNGNLHCDEAAVSGPGGTTMQSSESDKNGNLVYTINSSLATYRTHRLESLSIPDTP